jgi:hypothetical protein
MELDRRHARGIGCAVVDLDFEGVAGVGSMYEE